MQIISRSRGANVVEKAAYRAGLSLVDERFGVVYDYSRRSGVAHTSIETPSDAPAWAREWQSLWSGVEARELHPGAQLASEWQGSMPHVLAIEQQAEAVREFAQDAFADYGLVAAYAIHLPDVDGDPRNIHVHGLTTLREVGPDGFGAKSARWRPDFAFARGRRFVADASKLVELRKLWAEVVNRHLERAGRLERIDHRSYVDQGIEREPEPKMGPFATSLERRGIRTRAGDDRRAVQARNRERERSQSRSQDGVAYLLEPGEAVYPHPDERAQLRESVLMEAYGQKMAGSSLVRDWSIDRVANGLRFRGKKGEVRDLGDRIRTGKGTAAEVQATLDIARLKGWNELEFAGTDDFKRIAMRAALDAGFSVKAGGRDASLLEQVERERLALNIVPRDSARDARTVAPATSASPPAGTPPRSGSTPAAGIASPSLFDLDTQTKVARMLDDATRDRPTFTRQSLERVAAKFATSPDERAELVAAAAAHASVTKVGETHRGVAMYSTTTVLGLEQRMIDDVEAMVAQKTFGVPKDRVEAAIARRVAANKMSEQQAEALRHITGPGAFAALVGYAGAGKSTILKDCKALLQQEGYRVLGTALAAKAVRNLKDLGVEGRTIASYLRRWEPRDDGSESRNGLTNKDVVFVDEAGMVGTPQFAEIIRFANEAGAKVVAIGDPRQLQPVEGGGAFPALLQRFGAARLTEIWRQRLDIADADPQWMRKASRLFGDGKAVEGLRMYDDRGFVLEYATRDEARAALIERWASDRAADPAAAQLILASMNVDIADLNNRARAYRREHNELGPDVTVDTPEGKKLPAGPKTFAINDVVYFLQTDDKRGLDNGSMGTVTEISGSSMTVALQEDVPRSVTVNLQEYPDVTLGYAVVGHKAQGATIGDSGNKAKKGHTYVMASSFLDSELAYVKMTRHTDSALLYWSKDVFANKNQLYRVVGRSAAKGVALDTELQQRTIPSGSYLRTPVQVLRDVKSVMDTAKELHRSADAEHKPAADRALASMTEWFDRVKFRVDQLKSAEVGTIAVSVHPERFTERVAAIESSLERAVQELGQSPERGVAPVERAADERPEIEPVGGIELRVVDPDIVKRAEAALDSPAYLDATAGLLLLTGRYPSEILKYGEFQRGLAENTLLFSGQAKTRDAYRKETQYEIPVLANPDRVLVAIEKVRAARDFDSMTAKEINQSIGKSLGIAARRAVADGITPKDLRAAYLPLAYATAAAPAESRLDFNARVLNHAPDDIRTSLAWSHWAIHGNEQQTIAELGSAAGARLGAIAADIAIAREAGNDAQVGYLEDRIAILQTASWYAPVRKLDEVLELDGVAAAAQEALETSREQLGRVKAAEASLPGLPGLPVHPESAIGAELQQFRAQKRREAAATPAELESLRRLENRGDAAALREAEEIRAARARIRENADRQVRERERVLDTPTERDRRMNAYLADLERYRAIADSRERAAAQVRAVSAEVERSEVLVADVEVARKTGAEIRVVVDGKTGEDRMTQIRQGVRSAIADREKLQPARMR